MRDLVGVDVEMLSKLGQRLSPLMAASATFALKAGVWFRRARLLIVSPDSRAQLARCQAETPLIVLSRFPEPALSEIVIDIVSVKRYMRKATTRHANTALRIINTNNFEPKTM